MKTMTRLMAHQRKTGLSTATPTVMGEPVQGESFMKMESTYLTKGKGEMPKAGDRFRMLFWGLEHCRIVLMSTFTAWLPRKSYFSDMASATYGSITQDMVGKLQQNGGIKLKAAGNHRRSHSGRYYPVLKHRMGM